MNRKAQPAFAHLGQPSRIPDAPDAKTLDRAANPQADTDYIARFTAPEFTSICPVTGQPDFAHLVIDYAPDKWIIESKSLKLYLASFRNHGAFHEDCTVRIGKDLVGLLKPRWLRIGGYWFPRGGIPIDVFWQSGRLPKGVWLPDQGVAPYRGREADMFSTSRWRARPFPLRSARGRRRFQAGYLSPDFGSATPRGSFAGRRASAAAACGRRGAACQSPGQASPTRRRARAVHRRAPAAL